MTDQDRAPSFLQNPAQKLRTFETVMESTQDFVYLFDLGGKFAFANRAILELWDRPLEEVIGRDFYDLGYPPELADLHHRQIDEVITTGRPLRASNSYKSPTGESGFYEYIFTPIFDDHDEVEAVVGITRDITELKQAEQALREANRRKDRFLNVLSHELRNTLAPVKLNLYVLEHAPAGSDKQRRARQSIGRQVGLMTRLVDDLLDVTRINRNKLTLEPQRLELNELVEHCVDDHRSLFADHNIDLTIAPSHEEIFLDADPDRLAQVVTNLLHNAAKFTDPGGSTTVSLSADPGNDIARIDVQDTGVGIKEETLSRLFDPFFQGPPSTDQATGGLGLGLALVKGLITLHGGEVAISSGGPGKGTKVSVELPLESVEQPLADSPQSTDSGAGLRILLIEDNVDVAHSLSTVLDLKGHCVETAQTGSTGLECALSFQPDVVLCDIGLPGIDGYEVAQAMRNHPELEHIHLIALSGYARPEDIQKSKAAGFDHHLPKPPNMEQLRDLLADNT